MGSAEKKTWRESFMLGKYAEDEYQFVVLVVDVNGEETAVHNREQENGRRIWRGYNTSMSPFFRRTTRKFSRNYSAPLYPASSTEYGVYAKDVMLDFIDGDSNATFALVNRIEGEGTTEGYYGLFADGFLGLGRAKSQLTNFKPYLLRYGKTYCRAADCKRTDSGSHCYGSSMTRDEGGPDAYKYYKDSIYYTDVKASTLNLVGWTLAAQGFRYGSLKSGRPLRLTLSTTTDYLTVPTSTLKATRSGTKYLVDSEQLVKGEPLVFIINGMEVPIPAKDYLGPFGNGKVWLKINGGASEAEWIVGEPFTDAVAVCLDYEMSLASLYKVPLFSDELPARNITKNFRESRKLPDGTVITEEGLVP